MSRRSARFGAISVAALLPAVLFLNGCSAPVEAEAKATPVLSAEPTEYIPASADGPAQNVPIPESYNEMQEFSEEGLTQGAQAWLEAAHYLVVTGDSSLLKSLSTEDCPICLDTYESFEDIYDQGGWIDSSGVYEIDVYLTDFVEDDPTNYLAANFITPPETLYSENGIAVEENSSTEPETISVDIAMIFDEQEHRWKMLGAVINDLDEIE